MLLQCIIVKYMYMFMHIFFGVEAKEYKNIVIILVFQHLKVCFNFAFSLLGIQNLVTKIWPLH